MDESNPIIPTLYSLGSSFSYNNIPKYKSSSSTKSKSNCKSIFNSQLSTKSRLTKYSKLSSNLHKKLNDITPLSRREIKDYNSNNNNNSSFISFIKSKDKLAYKTPSTTKSSYPSLKRIAFNKFVPKQKRNRYDSPSQISHRPSKRNISKEIITISKKGIPNKAIKSSNSNRPVIKAFSILSPKKKVKNFLPKEDDGVLENSIKTPETYLQGVYSPIVKYQRKMVNQHLKLIHNEINVQYSNVFSLIQKHKFTEEYRLAYDLIDIGNSKYKGNNALIKKKRIEEMKIHNEASDIILANNKAKTQLRMNDLLMRYKTVMIRAAIHFKKLNISIDDFYNKDYATIQPFEEMESIAFIQAIKENDVRGIVRMIKKNNYLVFQFDYFKQTPLHWAAKRNLYQIAFVMISHGADPNSKDTSSRTPLHIAVQKNNFETLQMLLYGMANPFIKNNHKHMAIDLTDNPSIRFILQRTALLHTILKLGKAKDFERRLKESLDYLFTDELKTNFDSIKKSVLELLY